MPLKVASVLDEVELGEDVAENDAAALEHHFIETGSFQEVVADDCDLVLGSKGSGKSAIFRRLADVADPIPELSDVMVVPAFNVSAGPVFQSLSLLPEIPDEFQLGVLGWTYTVSLFGNRIVDALPKSEHTKSLEKTLREAGLRPRSPSPETLWASITERARRVILPTSLEFNLSLFPASVSAKADFSKSEDQKRAVPTVHLEDLFKRETAILKAAGRRCWLVFDRLDEAFKGAEELERVALRALLRTHLDIAAYREPAGMKLFLRDDLMNRVTKEKGFTNLDHLRSMTITWEVDDIAELVARRVAASRQFRKAFNLPTRPPRGRVLVHFLPRMANRDGIRWIAEVSSDGSRKPNPRNVLSILREARRRQLAASRRDADIIHLGRPLLQDKALRGAYFHISERRVNDTLYAEWNELRPSIELFQEHKYGWYPPATLARLFKLEPGSPELRHRIGQLVEAGFLRPLSQQRWAVASLYRPGLRITQPVEPENAELPAARVRVEKAESHAARAKAEQSEPKAIGAEDPSAVRPGAARAATKASKESEARRKHEDARRRVAVAEQIARLRDRIDQLREDKRVLASQRSAADRRRESAEMTVEMLRESLRTMTDPSAAAAAGKALGDGLEAQQREAIAARVAESDSRKAQGALERAQRELRALEALERSFGSES